MGGGGGTWLKGCEGTECFINFVWGGLWGWSLISIIVTGYRVVCWCLTDKGIHYRAMLVLHYTKEHKRNSQRNARIHINACC